jgi:hypothetical protein
MRKMKIFTSLFIVLSLSAGTVIAQSVSTVDVDIPWSVSIPCVPELATGTINLHNTLHLDRFGFVTSISSNPQGGELIGDVTGIVYRPAGMTKTYLSSIIDNGAQIYTYINNYKFVGMGGVQLRIQTILHVTVNANGDVTADIENLDSVCK